MLSFKFLIAALITGSNLCSSSLTPTANEYVDHHIVENDAKLPILTPSLSDQKILKLRLSNGLEAYIVSDPDIDKSAAALAVNTGSWSDPDEYPGMAHFLEHMLFLGTEKYPNESEFQNFIDNHGGSGNAYTSNDRTVYSFAVGNEAFPEALDRFAQFFIAPLFNPSGIQRERHAIDQEYAKNLESDNWRLLFVRKSLENSQHPDSRFNIGSLETISKISPETLRKWYESHYSANLMHLVIFSNLPIDTLKDIVVKDFNAVPNRHLAPLEVAAPLMTRKNCGEFVYVTPFQDMRHLVLFWSLPAAYKYDADIVAYALGDEGPKSLLAALKKEGLAENLAAGVNRYGKDIIFSVDVTLTESGVKNLKPILSHTFETIQMLKQKTIPLSFFNELKNLAEIKYQYQSRHDPFDTATDYADALIDEDIETFPEKTLIPQVYHPKAMEQVLDYLQTPPCQLYVVASPQLTGVPGTIKEPWMGAEYAIRPIPKDIVKVLSKPGTDTLIDLPPSNPFVPSHLNLVPLSISGIKHLPVKNLPLPIEVQNNENGQFFYAPDIHYQVPEIAYLLRIHSPTVAAGNPIQAVLLELFMRNIKETLRSLIYQASLANLSLSLDALDTGLSVSIQGYSEKSSLFLKNILEALKSPSFSKGEFEIIKQALMSEYENAKLSSPLQQGKEILKCVLYKNFVTSDEKATALKDITFEDLQAFSKNLFSSTYVEGTLFGNLSLEMAREIAKEVTSNLSDTPYPKKDIVKKTVVLLPESKGPFVIRKKISPQGNAAILMIENGCYSYKTHAALQILSKGLEEPFFSELRTKQQTGYLVGSYFQELQSQLVNFFMVQSNTYEPRDLLSRFDLMIERFLQTLSAEGIPQERFETLKKTVASELSQPPKNLQEMAQVINLLAFDYNADFEHLDKRLEGIIDLTYQEFLDLSKSFLGKTNRRRLGVLITGQGSEEQYIYTNCKSINPIRRQSQYLTRDQVYECNAVK